MKTLLHISTVLLGLLIFIDGCKKDVPDPGQVWIQNMAFSPSSVTIKANTTITWTNRDAVIHNVTSDSGWFSSGDIAAGASFSQQCNTPGTFTYRCSVHPTERGRVTVQ